MSTEARSAENVYLALDESLPVIHTALIKYFGFDESEAEAFKDTLAIWFHRVVRRGGIRLLQPDELRQQLMFVACRYAKAFQIAKLEAHPDVSAIPVSHEPPEEVAVALLNTLSTGTRHA